MMFRFYGLCIIISNFLGWVHAEPIRVEGILSQGGIIRGELLPGYTLYLNDSRIETSPQGYFVAGFGRDAASEQNLRWCDSELQCMNRVLRLNQRTYHEQRVDGVPQKTVTPPESVLARIRAETALVKQARQQSLPVTHFTQAFIKPLNGPRTGVYGSRRVYNGIPKRPHFGVDYAAPVGTPVVAPADAIVTLVHDDMYYSGGTLIMDHGYGFSSTFIHLSEVLVEEGQQVKQGEVVGRVGQGGRSTGPHLDWRINWYEVRMDPELLLELGEFSPEPLR